jgi:hypothetical protein
VCRDFAYALRGGGSWLEHEEGTREALRVAPPVPASEMDGVVGTTFLPEPLRGCGTRPRQVMAGDRDRL